VNLRNRRKLTSKVIGVGIHRVWFDPNKGSELKEAITREDFRKLVKSGSILIKQKNGVSRGRARKALLQKRKGRRSGLGSRKGKHTARAGKKILWVRQIRLYRSLFKTLLEKNLISKSTYGMLRRKAKGGYFRSRRHILLYLNENNLWIKKK